MLHIALALISLVTATGLVLAPTRFKLRLTYGLVVATLASGTYLALADSSRLVSACRSGLLYLGLVGVALVLGSRKLARRSPGNLL